MSRLDIELYKERLARHAERVAEELADARMILAWADLEQQMLPNLSGTEVARLEGMGILSTSERWDAASRSVNERERDLHAIHRMQVLVKDLSTNKIDNN